MQRLLCLGRCGESWRSFRGRELERSGVQEVVAENQVERSVINVVKDFMEEKKEKKTVTPRGSVPLEEEEYKRDQDASRESQA